MEKKPGLAIIIAGKAKDKEGQKEEGKNKYAEMGREILDCIKKDDGEKLATLLKNFVKVCCGCDNCMGE